MNIGEMINKFDLETDGTVKSFNEVFKKCPIRDEVSPETIVEIGDIVGVGQITKRFIELNGERKEHLFEHEKIRQDYSKRKTSMPKPRYKYCLTNLDTGETFTETTLHSMAKLSGVPAHTLKKLALDQKVKINYKMTREVLEKSPKLKDRIKKKQFEYIVSKNDVVRKFKVAQEVADFLGVTRSTVSINLNGHYKNKDGWKIERQEIK